MSERGKLGQAHVARGELAAAESAFRGAIEDEPGNAPWMFQLAGVLLKLDREFEAMELLRQGVTLLPDATCFIRLGHLELTFGDPAAALNALRQGLELDPRDANAHVLAAKSLMELGQDVEAERHWSKAMELAGGHRLNVELMRARSLREQGQFESAITCLNEIKRKNPGCVSAYSLLAESRRLTTSDLPLVRDMEALVARKGLSSSESMNRDYGLGKAYDDLERFEEAMTCFDRANAVGYAAISANGGFDRSQYADTIEARKEIFSQERIKKTDLGVANEAPIFVVGMIRSGTTLLERILARHPMVRGAGEQTFWLGLESQILDFRSRKLREDALRNAALTYSRLLQRYSGGVNRVVDKQPGNLLLAGALHLAFPEARVVYMRREPLDNAVSIWNTHIKTSAPFVHNKGNLAFAMQQHDGLMRYWAQVLPANRFMELTYESLVLDRESSTRRVLDFCGLPWDEACLSPEASTEKVITPSLWQVRQPVYSTSIGRWKNYEPWLGELRQLA